jgi:hypothetical protein
MCTVRLIRRVLEPDGTGPGNGQDALQRALRRMIRSGVDWLSIGGVLQPGEIPWYWCWKDRRAVVRWALAGRPLVQGPNTLFLNARRPRADALEAALLDMPQCRLMFTESEWYRELIVRRRGPENRAPIVLWPYPIDPQPSGPIEPPQHELLIYLKNGHFLGLVEALESRYRPSIAIRYGQYRQHDLWDAARRSRVCCYLADDDRGPLALAEILICGCPAVGIPTGAPFIRPGVSGSLVASTMSHDWIRAIEICRTLDRQHVAAWARREFDSRRIAGVVLSALDQTRRSDQISTV